MKYKKLLMTLVAMLFICIGTGIASVLLITHRFERIEQGSIFQILIGRELRSVPAAQGAVEVYFQSYPADGTSRGIDIVKIKFDGENDFYKQAIDHFVKLGYVPDKSSPYRLFRGEDEFTIEQRESYLEISKFF